MPAVLDETLDQLLMKHTPKFWHNRRVDELKQSWYRLRQESRLDDQKQASRLNNDFLHSFPRSLVSARLQPTESAAGKTSISILFGITDRT